jgi:ATP-dependent DNA helicase RecG
MSESDHATAPFHRLDTPVHDIPLIGRRRADLLLRLDIRTVADLIKHLPHRYERHLGRSAIAQLPFDQIATARGLVTHSRWVPGRQFRMGQRGQTGRFQAQLRDDTGVLDLVFFNAAWLRDKLHPGTEISVTGKVVRYNDGRQMVNPQLQVHNQPDDTPEPPSPPASPASSAAPDPLDAADRYRPVYPATEDLPSVQIERLIAHLLPAALPLIEDHFDPAFRQSRNLPELRQAYAMLHDPADEDQVLLARRRLAYDELLQLQLAFAAKRKHTRTELRAPALRWSDAIDAHIRQRFPFELTSDQRHVTLELARDLQQTIPMNRLLQGDVGSGKTVVALYAMLMAVAAGKQACLLAPTELLAEQHHASISRMLAGSTVRIGLLTGSITGPPRTALLHRIDTGQIDLVIGTHAILTQSVQFADLAVSIVDEQHRFGVVQRATIKSKAGDARTVPHTLVMTATPIPRTLSLTIFGDLDVSLISHLPPGRQPIVTRVVESDKSVEVYNWVAQRIAAGEQAYIVVPAIDENDPAIKAVTSHIKQLEAGPLQGKRIAGLHGKLKTITRERIMDRFHRGEIDVLVATTVIEVGVDVPNASIMVVEHAERFGLAQLHQLRGRVGRGSRKSYCVFIADPSTDDAQARMKAIAATTDGFAIAEADWAIRGMGEMLGLRQSGLPPFKVADLTQHMDLLQLARRDAQEIIEADPKLSDPSHDLLRKRLLKTYGQAIGLADVA